MSDSLKPGDTVRLNSGGPEMTVARTLGETRVVCKWFDGTKPREGVFFTELLSVVRPVHGPTKIETAAR